MSDKTSIEQMLAEVPCFELQPVFVSEQEFSRTHSVYSGLPRRHSVDEKRMVLVTGLESGTGIIYEFFLKDIDRWESVENMMTAEGQALPLVRIWVKHGAFAMRSEPFVVQGENALESFLKL